MKRTMEEELIETIENCENGDGVRCLLESIYGEHTGLKLFDAWIRGNEAKFKILLEEAK